MFRNTVLKIGAAMAILLAPAFASALDTTGYDSIIEYKAWGNKVEVILADEPNHACGEPAGTYRTYATDEGFEQISRALHSAFLAGRGVRLSYECVSGRGAVINGVRVR